MHGYEVNIFTVAHIHFILEQKVDNFINSRMTFSRLQNDDK